MPKRLTIEQGVRPVGLTLLLLTRLSPAFTLSLLDLACRVSEASLRDDSSVQIGSLPGTIPFGGRYALTGDVARSGEVLSGEVDAGIRTLRILGGLATVARVWLAGRAASRVIDVKDA